ncbi:GNAT family N-acetyltransferase [Sulfobacillus thermosulfidooxidans]|uniref:GNAT family N-acetyltransferase n=1 Tax=Sulfobacillus thermosulfidooxidans TaxID=28034 RepID=UPI0014950532|nr:GNAT family N-acetyltransferase [Sulfobacillus thermosulfidooxidans]
MPTILVQLRRDPSYGLWSGMIIHTADGLAIGSMDCKALPDDDGHVEIGYDIVPTYQNKGYATEIGNVFVSWVWEKPSVR